MKTSRAIRNTLIWISLALAFNAGVYYYQGQQKAMEFLTGYLIELSLSVDNIFVFLVIFKYFKIKGEEQQKILFWGVLGAQFMRLIFIFAGIALLNKFHWLIYILGAFLVFTGVKLLLDKDKESDPDNEPVIKLVRKLFPKLSTFWMVLIVVEVSDLIFAVDSIPAVLAITKDPFIVYTSNVFAIMGLRSMYFALAGTMDKFYLLHYALGIILTFVGLKMVSEHFFHVPIAVALGFVVTMLVGAVVLSLLFPKRKH